MEFQLVTQFSFIRILPLNNNKLFQGVEYEENTADGRKCKTIVTMDGDDTMVMVQKGQREGERNVFV